MGRIDQQNPSYWIGSTRATDYPRPSAGVSVDVAVIGGGITGLTTAFLAAQAGLAVAVIEYNRLASGTTGYTTAKVTSQHRLQYASLIERNGEQRARMYAEAQQAAMRWIANVVDERGIACDFRRLPAYVYTEQEEKIGELRAELAAAESLGLPAGWRDETPLPFEVAGSVRFDDQAIFHPRKYCLGLADAITSLGGRIFERTRATNVEDGDPCRIETEEGDVRARHVVIATGLPFPADGAYFARAKPSRSYAIAAPGPDLDGMFISAESPTRSVRPHESGDERMLVFSGEEHPVGQEPDTEMRYKALEDFARERFGVGRVGYRWSAQDYIPADGIPYVGFMTDDTPHVFVATGFLKWGMTNGTAAAMMIADAIAGRENPWAKAFDSTRIRPAQSARKVA
ncbi:MAG TPA: FAD-dependent oxidoreductase, partial [Actinomycetota bacterium]|nr:FAD-dependent oxidoreductase [Actinomycetota bacterium]